MQLDSPVGESAGNQTVLLCGDGIGNPQWLETEHDQPSPADFVSN